MPGFASADVVVGTDVSKNTIVAGVLTGDGVLVVESLSADEASVRRFSAPPSVTRDQRPHGWIYAPDVDGVAVRRR
jgi:hypothetical protein